MTMAAAIEEFRVGFPASQFFTDLCNIVIDDTETPDGFGGTSADELTLASNVPCKYQALSLGSRNQIAGGVNTNLTHKITLPATAITKVIQPHYRIVVRSLNGQPQLTFRNPVTLDGSFGIHTTLAAELSESRKILPPGLLLESGFALLQENGYELLLEA